MAGQERDGTDAEGASARETEGLPGDRAGEGYCVFVWDSRATAGSLVNVSDASGRLLGRLACSCISRPALVAW